MDACERQSLWMSPGMPPEAWTAVPVAPQVVFTASMTCAWVRPGASRRGATRAARVADHVVRTRAIFAR